MSYSRRDFIFQSGLAVAATAIGSPHISNATDQKIQTGNRLVLLGTQGGPFIHSYKPGPSASLIVFRDVPFIIDTGYGVTFKLIEAGINLASLQYVFITHHHSDHNLELGPLLYNAWLSGLSSPIHVYAPEGLKSLLDSYWKSNSFDLDTRIKDEGRPNPRKLVIAHEYSEGVLVSNADTVVTAVRNIHPPIENSFALKFKLKDKQIVFSGDTAYCEALVEFAKGADYLVHEVMYGPAVEALVSRRPNAARLKASILSHHTLAEDVGRIASQAKVRVLVLNHFVPPDDKTITDQVWISAVRSTFSGEVVVGKDLLNLPF